MDEQPKPKNILEQVCDEMNRKRATLDDVVAALLLMKHTLDEIADMLQDVKGKTPDGMGVLDVRVNKD